jgi:tellurite resistance protein
MKFLIILSVSLLASGLSRAYGQQFNSDLKQLNSQIEAAYKAKKLTETEYGKLKKEQDIIKFAMEKANADGTMTPDEKNKIHSKIIRSKKRLAKYKTNREVY